MVDQVRETILDGIAAGRYPEGSQLPPEQVLAEEVGASRLTAREAVKLLAAEGVLRAVHGRGTFVNEASHWVSIDAVFRMQPGRRGVALGQLFEVRSMLEIGAARLFAPVATAAELAAMEKHLEAMRAAHADGDAARAMSADLAFHDVILSGCGNPFVSAALQPISGALVEARRETSRVPLMREHAIGEHAKILDALRTGDGAKAAVAMSAHMQQTIDDAERAFPSQ